MQSRTPIGGLALLCSVLLGGRIVRADVTDTTPYDYDHPPKVGREAGTYGFTGSGAFGPDCVFVAIGTAKFLPNGAGTGGTFCSKLNLELRGSGPACASAPVAEPALAVVGGTYTYNGDGTICENLHIVGSPLNGMPMTFHTYVSPDGKTLVSSAQDIAYACPGIVPNGQITATAVSMKIGQHGDDPPGSGQLPCTNP